MADFLVSNEAGVRLAFFFGIFAVMAIWEIVAPRRRLLRSKGRRWVNNISLVVVNTVILRLLFPLAALGMAEVAAAGGHGLFNNVDWPPWLEIVLAVILLDLAIYLQHVMFHAVPAFWRLHRVHHADPDFDVTTGARFHPIEIILSMLIKFGVILLLGPAAVAVVVFEILLNATSMFNHSNVRIPLPVDALVRLLVVTPDMHRVHHSHLAWEANSNFGFSLSLWDRLFGTYRAQPEDGHDGMKIGIDTFVEDRQCVRIDGLLMMPFFRRMSGYAINRRWENGQRE